MHRIKLEVRESRGLARRQWPLHRGVPVPPGEVTTPDQLWVEDPQGQPVPAQFRVLGRWPDHSLKWVLVDFRAEVGANGTVLYHLCCGGENPEAQGVALSLEEDERQIRVDTGVLRFALSKERFGLLEEVEFAGRRPGGNGEAWVRICESWSDGGLKRRIYGMGGDCLASLPRDVYQVSIEEAGPLRAVIRCEGAFEADLPMHHYAGYRPFRLVVRIYAYAGQPYVRVLHTVVVACDPRQTEVEQIGVRLTLGCAERFWVGANRVVEGVLREGEVLLSQGADNYFSLERQGIKLAEGERAEGWIAAENGEVGVGVALRHLAEEYPKALKASSRGLEVFLWRDPEGKRLHFRRYAEEVAWHEGEGVYADGMGSAKTSEFFVAFYRPGDDPVPLLRGLLAHPHVAVDPQWMARCQAAGGFAPRDEQRFPASERMMAGFLDWLERNIRLGRWYGFLDWGDALVAWDESAGDWRFHGRWGWCNSEWDPRHGVWVQYLRTGEAGYFALGEAMTRHSADVDTCHFHPLRPYRMGGCFRHSVDHFGDEPTASHTFVDNWVDYYYLTGDLRTLEVLRETGTFFLRYSWTEDPRFSFSLRSIANVLRGLLQVYEVTGEDRFRQRAEEVYEVIARGQNEDGSWHKRFQVSTPDRLPDQAPYGMATEGTTLAVELGTAAPFTDEEYRTLGGGFTGLRRVLPHEEQKGYQTHYLMIGLEMLHRLTEREEVAQVYLRAVDWFCGNSFDAGFAVRQHYGGIICRHLGYAWRLSGERRYLEMGRAVLRHLIESQDHSEDTRKRGAVGLSPMYVSLLFFGVPYLLGALQEAGMED
ncbi:MAG: hypothetical protein FJY95_08180 [Candidatus Handelsmanbacteria bacterium]|nr:hypothetical protein [Candidatus Handelsmanbacteria bacterium]